MKKINYFLIGLALALGISTPTTAQSASGNTSEISDAATVGIKYYLGKIPAGHEKDYGFNSTDELAIASPGTPMREYAMNKQEYNTVKPSDGKSIVALSEWMVPVMVNGECRAFLTIAKMKGKWKAVNFGSAPVAKEVNDMQSQFIHSTGTLAILILQREEAIFILQMPSADFSSWVLYPLSSARVAFNLAPEGSQVSYTMKEMLSRFKTKIEQEQKN